MALILLVDDPPSLLGLLAETLPDKGHRVLAATAGHEALRLVSGRLDTIDLVIPTFKCLACPAPNCAVA